MNPPPDFTKQLVDTLFASIEKGTIQAFTWIWNGVTSYLLEHWIAVSIVLLVVLIIAIVRAFAGRWGMLGSVLYTYLYGGTLLLIGSIWGPAVFANTYADIGFFLLYVVCFILVGRILIKTGLKRRY